MLTRRPFDDPPPAGVEARSGDVAVVAAELEARGYRRVWIEGGGQVVRSMIAIGKLDVLYEVWEPLAVGQTYRINYSPHTRRCWAAEPV